MNAKTKNPTKKGQGTFKAKVGQKKKRIAKTKDIVRTGRILEPTKINWHDAEMAYVQGEDIPSVLQIAREFKVTKVTAYKWAHRGHWHRKRADYWKDVHKAVASDIKSQMVSKLISRFHNISEVVDKLIRELVKKRRIDEMTTNDLLRLLQVERDLIAEIPTEVQDNTDSVNEIMEAQIIRIRSVGGQRQKNFNQTIDAGLRRLGIVSGETADSEAGDGFDEERQGVRVRHQPSS